MATKLTNNTFFTTYRDDYDRDDNYHRILFNSGEALQARELTQLQTITQEEISRMGNNLFRDGSAIRAGNITVNNDYEYIKLDTTLHPLPVDRSKIFNVEFISPSAGIKFRVLELVEEEDGDPATLYVRYTSTVDAQTQENQQAIRMPNNVTFRTDRATDIVTLKSSTLDASGRGCQVSSQDGEYFVKGRFVHGRKQSAIISKYVSFPTTDIGFVVAEEIVTVADDPSLYDNQGEAPNIAAPGADRYRIKLNLTSREKVQDGENFVYLARLVKGVVVDQTDPLDAYAKINDVLAQRTKEESGNYVVQNFNISIEDLNSTQLEADISSGIAYVDGYRLDITGTKRPIDRALDTQAIPGQNAVAVYGQYVTCEPGQAVGLPSPSTMQEVTLIGSGGFSIGTARVRQIQEDNGKVDVYLFDIRLSDTNESFRNTRSLEWSNSVGGTGSLTIELDEGIAILKNTANNSLLFDLPSPRPAIDGVNIDGLVVQRVYDIDADADGQALGVGAGDQFTFTNTSLWVIAEIDGPVVNVPTYELKSGGNIVDISGLTQSKKHVLVAYVAKSQVTARQKSLVEGVEVNFNALAPETDQNGNQYFNLGRTDIIRVTDIKFDNANGQDISDRFIIDNGQRDNFYGLGRLVLKPGVIFDGQSIVIYCKFDHFNHGLSGDFFSINSYNGILEYNDIPSYTKANGDVVSLRDVLDFRSSQDASGNYGGGVINPLPQPTDIINGTITYHMPRRDRVIATVENSRDGRSGYGDVRIVKGIPDMDPQLPQIPPRSLPLFDIYLNPATLNDGDLSVTAHVNKRYTMQDIDRLSERVDALQELTTLSLLELSAASVNVFDSAGVTRTKSGFLADNFATYSYSDTNSSEYKASIDTLDDTVSCQQYPHALRLILDQQSGINQLQAQPGIPGEQPGRLFLSGDIITLPREEDQVFISQTLASSLINVNPFAVVSSIGDLNLSPSRDDWVEVVNRSTSTESTQSIQEGSQNVQQDLSNWRDDWFGAPTGDTNTAGSSVNVTNRTERVLTGIDRILERVETITNMRSRKISFQAFGLRENARHFPFFNGKRIDEYTRQEPFEFYANTSDDAQVFAGVTSHPDGSTELRSDGEGRITGSFVIPSNDELSFRTDPAKAFQLLDISAFDEEEALSQASKLFTASGQRVFFNNVSNFMTTTFFTTLTRIPDPPRRRRWWDPVAQSFVVSEDENPNGIVLSKARLYFATKDTSIPVSVEIVATENGIPTAQRVPGAFKYLSPSEVNVPTDINNLSQVQAAPTDFTFDEPVYLPPGREYAIIVRANSTNYQVYVAETTAFELGSTERRITKQAHTGSFFMSQNSSTWTPDQDKDMMFELYRADYREAGSFTLQNAHIAPITLQLDPFELTQGSNIVRVRHTGHGFNLTGDEVVITGFNPDELYANVPGSNLNGRFEIKSVDYDGYTIEISQAVAPNSTVRVGGSNIKANHNIMFNSFIVTTENATPPGTGLATNVVVPEGASFNNPSEPREGDNSMYAIDNAGINISLNTFNITNKPKVIASPTNESIQYNGNRSLNIKYDMSTTDTKVTPLIDLQSAQIAAFENIIDNNAPGYYDNYVAETAPTGGSALAKHITTPVNLSEEAVGLKIIIGANRPAGSDFDVYIRTATGDDDINNNNYQLVEKESQLPTDANRQVFRDYEYLAGGVGGDLSAFSVFQIKVVLKATNTSRVPRLRDLRVVALAV